MALVLRASVEERVIRSVDDTPGMLGLADDESGRLFPVVYDKWEPGPMMEKIGKAGGGQGVVMDIRNANDDDELQSRTELEVEVVVDACVGALELSMLRGYWTAASVMMSAEYVHAADFERLVALAEAGIAFREALWRRFRREEETG